MQPKAPSLPLVRAGSLARCRLECLGDPDRWSVPGRGGMGLPYWPGRLSPFFLELAGGGPKCCCVLACIRATLGVAAQSILLSNALVSTVRRCLDRLFRRQPFG